MLSGLTAGNSQFVNNVNKIQSQLNKVQAELSSGLAVNQASDAPDQVSAILQLHANIQQNQEVQNTLNAAKGEVTTADQSMSTAITLMDSAQTLAAQGLGMNQTAATRATLAGQVQSLMQQMVGLASTTVSGKYIFSGDADQSASYQFDASAPTGVDRLQVSAATRHIPDGAGGTIPVSQSANDIFDQRDSSDKPTANNVFAALNAVRVALQNNDATALQAGSAALTTASAYLNQQQGFYGAAENSINNALTNASTAQVSLQQDLSNRQDADETQAIEQMTQYATNLQAAIASQAKMPQTNLFQMLNG